VPGNIPLVGEEMPVQQPARSTSLDIPPSLEAIISQQVQAPAQPAFPGVQGALTGNFSFTSPPPPSFQVGGQVGPGGMPIRPGQPEGFFPPMAAPPQGAPGLAAPGAAQTATPEDVMMEAQRFAQSNPVQLREIQTLLQQGIQSGEFTVEELNVVVQMAVAAVQNPELWPQLRGAMIQQGVADEDDLPQEFDPGFMFTLIVVGEALGGSQNMQQPQMSMEDGGPLPERSGNPDGSIPINAHEGEYVIPKEVVRQKGVEFFDNLVAKYRDGGQAAKGGTGA
jgi:hypothetical protein